MSLYNRLISDRIDYAIKNTRGHGESTDLDSCSSDFLKTKMGKGQI